jgi:Fe(3+) dicitrate transport protein
VTKSTEIYANYSQAYRPIQFANLQAPPSTDVVDPDLKDAKGYNIDLGYRGKIGGYLQFDLSTYYLQYNNRIGTITPAGANYRLITNVGASTSKGVETYAEFNVLRAFVKNSKADLSVFATYSYNDARYSGSHKDANTKGKKVENAPANIFRGGVSAAYNGIQLTVQVSYVDKTYSDANNTVAVSANAQNGLIPSYTLTDLTASWKFAKNFQCKAGINNLFNENYFTRRAGGYPGPGALPGDGRTMFLSIGAKF